MRTLVKAKYILTNNGGRHEMLEDACLLYEGHDIVFIGKDYDGDYDELIDESQNLLLPGFIDLDALGDVDHSLIFEGFPSERLNDLSWSRDYFETHRKEEFSAEEEALKSLYAYVHLIRNGITTAMPITSVICKKNAETYEEIEAAAHHAGKLGLRVYLGPSYLMKKPVLDTGKTVLLEVSEEEQTQGLQNAKRFIENFHGAYDGLIHGAVVPERIEQQTEESLKASKQLADAFGVPIRLHAAQGLFEYDHIKARTGLSPVAYLESIGFLGAKTLIPHCLFVSGSPYVDEKGDNDLDILLRTGTSVIHCPLVYARSGKAMQSFGRFRRKGINLSMGTDTFPPDMIENIKIGSLLAKYVDGDKVENSVLSYYEAATLGGSRALGRDDLGRLAVGAKADMIVIDLQDFELGVLGEPLTSLLINGNGRLVKTSIINGRVVMRDRVIPAVDLEELTEKAQGIFEHMKHSYHLRSQNKAIDEGLFFPKESLPKKIEMIRKNVR